MAKKYATLNVLATLEIDPNDLAWLDAEDLQSLQQNMYEAMETIVRLKFERGKQYRAQIRFMTPEPPALKLARQQFLGKA